MNPFITFRDKDKNNELQYYILQREFPHFCGLISHYPKEGDLANQSISGYSLWITFSGTIRGQIIPSYTNIAKEINSVFESMASWFYANRILTDKKRFEKFKIKNNDSSPT